MTCIVANSKNLGSYYLPKDETIKQQWIKALRLDSHKKIGRDLRPYSTICSNHFKPSDFIYSTPSQEKCFQDLGCVVLTAEWTHPVHRPKNVLPADRHVVNTVFIRWKMRDKDVAPEILGSENMNLAQSLRGVKLFVHDFTSNGYTGWIKHLSRAMLSSPEYVNTELISVNWALGAEPPYLEAIANARLVALEIVHFLNILKSQHHLNPNGIHVIGHGVGAHIGGYVGKLIQLRQITALDPTGPFFRSMPANVRLHRDDAKYVEVIHSDVGPNGQGYDELLGHVDFYPNGGGKQPGCVDSGRKLTSVKKGDLKVGESVSACSHKRSLKYYIEALNNPTCSFLGISCNSYKDFIKGKCVSCGDKMELCTRLHPVEYWTKQLNNTNGFYFVTSNSAPFCGEILKVVLHLKGKTPKQRYVKGCFKVKIPQRGIGDVKFFLNENHVISLLRANQPHFFVVFRSTPPTLQLPAKIAFVKWVRSSVPCAFCIMPEISYLVIQKVTDSAQDNVPQSFCPMNTVQVLKKTNIISLEPCSNPINGIAIDDIMVKKTIPMYYEDYP